MKTIIRIYFLFIISIIIIFPNSVQAQATFGPEQVISDNANSGRFVYSTDLDGDGDNDVLAAFNDKIVWYENDGISNFGTEQIIITSEDLIRSVFVDDIDGDGDYDVIWGIEDEITRIKNDGSGSFADQDIIGMNYNDASLMGVRAIFCKDLDGDGDNDIISAAVWDGKITWYENLLDGYYSDQIHISTVGCPEYIYSIDLDGDEDNDILFAAQCSGQIGWYENDGSGDFGPKQVINSNIYDITSIFGVDLDGDGDNDMLTASAADDQIAWYENDGSGGFGSQQIINDADGLYVYSIDLDGDGDNDVLTASAVDYQISWYENDGSGGFGSQQIINSNGGNSLYSIDLDGDGDNDILSASSTISWYENIDESDLESIESNPTCIGANAGFLEITITDGVYPPYTYEWTLDDGLAEGNGSSEVESFSIDGLVGGTYDLIIINAEQDTTQLENIVIEEISLPIINASPIFYGCETDPIYLSASFENTNTVLWESEGDGIFNNANAENPVYLLGPDDLSQESINLSLSAYNEACPTETTNIEIIKLEEITWQIEEICDSLTGELTINAQLSGGLPAYEESETYSISGDYILENTDGSFNFVLSDISDPSALSMTVSDASNNCSNTIELTVECSLSEFEVEILENDPSCINANTGSIALNISNFNFPPFTYEWILEDGLEEGSGMIESEVFTIEGLAAGTYDLMIINAQEDTVQLSNFVMEEISLPIINASPILYNCKADSIYLSASFENTNTIEWESEGDGNFDDANTENPVYILGPDDLSQQSINLSLSANNEACPTETTNIEIIQLEEITWEVEEICDSLTGELTINAQLSGGLPAYDESETYSISGDYSLETTDGSFSFVLSDISEPSTLSLIASDMSTDCDNTIELTVECSMSTSIHTIKQEYELTQGDQSIEVKSKNLHGYQLLNLNGQILQSDNFTSPTDYLNVPTNVLAAGVYLLQLDFKNQSITKKIIIQ